MDKDMKEKVTPLEGKIAKSMGVSPEEVHIAVELGVEPDDIMAVKPTKWGKRSRRISEER